MWIIFALLSALTAALVAILAKAGLRQVDTTLATTLRSVIMAVFLVGVSIALGKFNHARILAVSGVEWTMLTLAGIAGALSWLFYFMALRGGPATAVAAIDRLSVVFVVLLAAIFLAETLTWRSVLGALLMSAGAVMIASSGQSLAEWWRAITGASSP